MYLPNLTVSPPTAQKNTLEFRGINYRDVITQGEMSDSKNITTMYYPVLTQRKPRKAIKTGLIDAANVMSKDNVLYWIQANKFYYNGVAKGNLTEGKKHTAVIGDRIVIFPDRKYYDITDDKFGDLHFSAKLGVPVYKFSGNKITSNYPLGVYKNMTITISGCKTSANNKKVTITAISQDGLTYTTDGSFSTAQEGENVSFTSEPVYEDLNGYYIAIVSDGISDKLMITSFPNDIGLDENCIGGSGDFKDIDGSTGINQTGFTNIQGYSYESPITTIEFRSGTFNKSYEGRANVRFGYRKTVAGSNIKFTTNSIVFTGGDISGLKKGDAIKITGDVSEENLTTAIVEDLKANRIIVQDGTFVEDGSKNITVTREVPELEQVCEFNNRIWGTKGNTIYASKLGDAENFNVFAGISSDSYSLEVATEGDFTGCIGYRDHILFFKENLVYKIYGTKPINYSLSNIICPGVQKGSELSLVIVGNTLFYKSNTGVMAYGGGTPSLLDDKFSDINFTEAKGGTDGERYYLNMKKGNEYYFMCYDIQRGLWVREDDTEVDRFFLHNGKNCFYSKDTIFSCNDESDERLEWFAEFGETTEFSDTKKDYKKFYIHMAAETGSYVRVLINCDRTGYKCIYSGSFNKRKTISIPVMPNRCDIFSMRIEGTGRSKIYSITEEIQSRGV